MSVAGRALKGFLAGGNSRGSAGSARSARWIRPGKRLASLAAAIAISLFFLVMPGQRAASAQGAPVITSVSPIVAQNETDNPVSGEQSGPSVVITGSGFGASPPLVSHADNGTVGNSAIGFDTLTNSLLFQDTSHSNDDMGLYPDPNLGTFDPFNDCDVSIGSWSDTQIVVLLDDTGGESCEDLEAGDAINVQVWDTNEQPTQGTASNSFPVTVIAQGTTPDLTNCTGCGLSPASGPTTGGTFNPDGTANANGTITVTGTNLATTSAVWFGTGGSDGAIATTNFTLSGDDSSLTVTPPPAPDGGDDEGVWVEIGTPTGTSVVTNPSSNLSCVAIDDGCQGTYYYESQSGAVPNISGTAGPFNFNAALNLTAAIPQPGGACPGSAGGTGITFTASAQITGGPVSFSGTPETSINDLVLSSAQIPISVDVQQPVSIAIAISGSVSACFAVPIPGVNIDGLGGLYVVIGGNITANYTLNVTINAGTFIVDAGYVANQLLGASVTDQNCVANGVAAPCITTSSSASISGTLDFSPLWLGVDINADSLVLSAGAGLTVAAFVTDSTSNGFDYDVCFGGTYAASVSVGPVSLSTSGTFFGPFNIYGDGTQCPLGAIGGSLPSTSVAVKSSANPSSPGQAVTYTATVTPTDDQGTVSFADNNAAIPACETQPLNASGEATCQVTYQSAESDSIVATYSGDAAFQGSASPVLTQVIGAGGGPGAPTLNTATPGNGSVTLGWTAPSSDGGSPITGYNVFEGTSSGGESTSPVNASPLAADATGYTATGLTNGTPEFFTVEALNANGPSPASNELSATPSATSTVPGAPTLNTASPGNASVTLGWTGPSSDGGSPITGYNVFEGTSSGGESTTPVNASPLAADATGYTATGLTNGTPYYFTVEALNANGPSVASDERSATPSASSSTPPTAPLSLHAAFANASVVLTWEPPSSDGGSPIKGYNVYEGTASGGESTTPVNASPLPASATGYTATGLTNGKAYYFIVKAFNSVGASPGSNQAAAIPRTEPSAPTSLKAAFGNLEVVLTWSAPVADGGIGITGYDVYVGTKSGGESSTPVNSKPLAPTARGYTATGLVNGTTYYFVVKAINPVGTGAASNQASASPRTVPSAPTSLKAALGNLAIVLTWVAPASNGGNGITGYNVYRGTKSGGESSTPLNSKPLASTARGYTSTGLVKGTAYYFVVKAINGVGSSAASNQTYATAATVPSAPGGAKSAPGNGQITVSWTAPTSDGGSVITGYDVYSGTSPGHESTTPVNSKLVPATARSYTATGLKNGTRYYLIVRAVNAAGKSAASKEVSAAPVGPPTAPRSLKATVAGALIHLSWTVPSSNGGSAITGYNVYYGTSPGHEGSKPLNAKPFPPNAFTATVSGLTKGVKYYFVVKAINAKGLSPASNEVSDSVASVRLGAATGRDRGAGAGVGVRGRVTRRL